MANTTPGMAGALFPESSDMLAQYMPSEEERKKRAYAQMLAQLGFGIMGAGRAPPGQVGQGLIGAGMNAFQAYNQGMTADYDAAMKKLKTEEELTKMRRDRDAYKASQAADEEISGLQLTPDYNATMAAIDKMSTSKNEKVRKQAADIRESYLKRFPAGQQMETRDAQGRPVKQLINPITGEQIGQAFPQAIKGDWRNTGQQDVMRDPYTGEAMAPPVQMQMTPESVASNKVAWANNQVSRNQLDLAREREAREAQQAQQNYGLAQGRFGLDQQRLALEQQRLEAQQAKDAQGRDVPESIGKNVRAAGAQATASQRQLETFQKEFAHPIAGELPLTVAKLTGDKTGEYAWWQGQRAMQTKERHDFFGSAMTKLENENYRKIAVEPGQHESVIRANLAERASLEETAARRLVSGLVKSRYNKEQIESYVGGGLSPLTKDPAAVATVKRGLAMDKAATPAKRTEARNKLLRMGIDPEGL